MEVERSGFLRGAMSGAAPEPKQRVCSSALVKPMHTQRLAKITEKAVRFPCELLEHPLLVPEILEF